MDSRRVTERDEARSLRAMQIVFAAVMLAVLVAKIATTEDSTWAIWGIVPSILLVALAVGQTLMYRRALKHLETLKELSEYISTQPRWMRLQWLWIEYVMARNVARGSYQGERPWDFKDEATVLGQDLIRRTRMQERQLIAVTSVLSMGAVAFVLLVEHRMWFLPAIPGVFGLYVVLMYRGRERDRVLARRIEAARDLPTQERWQELMSIASEQLATQLTSASSRRGKR